MICGKNTLIFLNILEILLMLCESCTEDNEKIRGGDCNTPRTCPNCIMNCNYVLYPSEPILYKLVGLCVY
jgi:hypothetical protein